MARNPVRLLMLRLLFTNAAIASFGVVLITLHNLYINRLEGYFEQTFLIKCGMGLLLIVVFQWIGFVRLRRARTVLRHASLAELPVSERQAAWSEWMRLPKDMFLAMLCLGLAYSPAYHLLALQFGIVSAADLQTSIGLFLLENLLFDQALSLMLAVLFYVVLRRISRPYLAQLHIYRLQQLRVTSIAVPLMAAFISLFLISLLAVLWFVMNAAATAKGVPLPGLFLLAAATFIIGVTLFAIEVFRLRRNARELIGIIRMLLSGRREQLHGQMPIVTNDELGQLAAAFNRLQERTAQVYREVENELKLAYNVQQQLLPKSYMEFGPLQVSGLCRPTKDVGGDWFDVQPLSGGRVAVVVGDVTGKGVQAALIMSAVVVLLRTELRHGGRPEDIMRRLNRQLLDTVQQATYVTLGLALFHPDERRMDYVSAGHMWPYRLRGGGIAALDASSLPLGVDAAAEYRALSCDLQDGDRFVFYTDGVVEAKADAHDWLGFEGFERRLLELGADASPEAQVRALLEALRPDSASPYADDQTVVLVRVNGHA